MKETNKQRWEKRQRRLVEQSELDRRRRPEPSHHRHDDDVSSAIQFPTIPDYSPAAPDPPAFDPGGGSSGGGGASSDF